MSGNEIDPAVVEAWRAAYAAVYGCEITHPAYMYGNAYPIIQAYGDQRAAQSADRIAELEAALESIADHNKVREWTKTSDNPETHWVTRDGFYAVIARSALNPSARSE